MMTTRVAKAKTKGADAEKYVLKLYVSGMTPRSRVAISNAWKLCEERLGGRYDLEVIDLTEHPGMARKEQIIAAPTLIKKLPAPLRRLIGDLSNRERVEFALDIKPTGN